MIQVKTLFTDWHEVTMQQAVDYAIHLFTKSNCDSPITLVNSRIKGIHFTEEDLYAIINGRREKNIE